MCSIFKISRTFEKVKFQNKPFKPPQNPRKQKNVNLAPWDLETTTTTQLLTIGVLSLTSGVFLRGKTESSIVFV